VGIEQKIKESWYWEDSVTKQWRLMDTHRYEIFGGRDGGWRSYFVKRKLAEGPWKVEIKTQAGKLVGVLDFEVEFTKTKMPLKTILVW